MHSASFHSHHKGLFCQQGYMLDTQYRFIYNGYDDMSRELFALFSVPWDGISVSKFSHGERDMDRGSTWFAFPPNKQDIGGESKQITLQAAPKPVWHNPVIVYRDTDRLMGKCVTSDGDRDALSEQMIQTFSKFLKTMTWHLSPISLKINKPMHYIVTQ